MYFSICFTLSFRVHPLTSDVFQYIFYAMFTGTGDMASSLPAKIFQGQETHRIIYTQAARIGIILYKKKKRSREVKLFLVVL